jgi:hypothetical protein
MTGDGDKRRSWKISGELEDKAEELEDKLGS